MNTRINVVVGMLLCMVAGFVFGDGLEVKGIKAQYRNGQTFITWQDAAEGEAGMNYRYTVYSSDKPITEVNLDEADLQLKDVINNSGQLFGWAWRKDLRVKGEHPGSVLQEGVEPLPKWSGLGVVTVKSSGNRYYAVAVTEAGKRASKIVAGQSSTVKPVSESVADIAPIKLWDSNNREAKNAERFKITGDKGLPLEVRLHASGGYSFSGTHKYGDYYLCFAKEKWGWRDGLPGVFAVDEWKVQGPQRVRLVLVDAILNPKTGNFLQTYWFGYVCNPIWAEHEEPRAYNFTEKRVLWTVDFVKEKYGINTNKIYAVGGSMGAWGCMTFALRHPEVFSAVYPNRPRAIQTGRQGIVRVNKNKLVNMPDGKTDFYERMNMIKFVSGHPEDLPFVGWCCGRKDGFATWPEQVDMVKAMTKMKHGFAFAWNNGNHSGGSKAMRTITKHYPADMFARNESYPAFGNSSIDQNLGSGDPEDGDLEGGINLGFKWSDIVDQKDKWSVTLSNELCIDAMTVDVTPRRCQEFKPKPGAKLKWSTSNGDKGSATADVNGIVTISKVKLTAGGKTVLEITK